ncbi:MAG: DUF4397 domain-containing protein [Chitinophagaceae bacterium]
MKQKSYLFLLGFLAFMAACKIDKNDLNNRTGRLRIINASAISGGANLEVDYKLVYDKYCEYLNYSLFRDYIEGAHKIKIRDISTNVVIDTQINIVYDKSYTLFIYDTLSTIRCKLVEEQFIVPNGANAKVRFLHLSNNADSVSFQKGNDSIPVLSGFVNGMNSQYLTYIAGPTSFTAIRTKTGDTLGTPFYTDLQAGRFYTVFVKGVTTSSGIDSIGIFSIFNNGEYE